MSRKNNSPSLFRVLAEETLVEYTAAAAISAILVGMIVVPINNLSPIVIALCWSLLSLSLYLGYKLPKKYTYASIVYLTLLILTLAFSAMIGNKPPDIKNNPGILFLALFAFLFTMHKTYKQEWV